MATPRTLNEIDKAKAEGLISRHLKDGTGWWEGVPYQSDFVYEYGTKAFMRKLIRPPCTFFGAWETGRVSL